MAAPGQQGSPELPPQVELPDLPDLPAQAQASVPSFLIDIPGMGPMRELPGGLRTRRKADPMPEASSILTNS